MKDNVGRLSLALFLLVGVWITVYTVWQPDEPPITFGTVPVQEPVVPPAPIEPERDAEGPAPQPVGQRVETPRSPAVIPPRFSQYTIKAGDTLQSISRAAYGTTAHADAIGRANPFMDPSRLRPGRAIRLPQDPGNIQGLPRPGAPPPTPAPPSSSRRYVVKRGDTLSEISQREYGTPAHAGRIFEANKGSLKSPDDLRVGIELVIPILGSEGSGAASGKR